jgi:acid phosphatase
VALYYKANTAGGKLTITVSTSAATYIQATLAEYSGASTTSPIDQVVTGAGNGAAASVGPTGALGAANELVYAATSVGASVSSMAAGSGFTLRSSPAADATGEEDAIASSTAGQSASMSFGNATDWNMVIATIKPASTVCTPTTCAAKGANCGTISDGCGGTLSCGTCTPPQTCGGGGAANVCGGGTSTGAPHVMLIVMENHGYHDIIGSSSAPYINSLATGYASATAWFDLAHPSLPNYLALTAGSIFTSPPDCIPTWSRPTGDCTFNTSAPNLADQLSVAGISWNAYNEDLPSACDKNDNFGPGFYDVNHNPFMYYDNVVNTPAECNRDVPYTQLATDLASGSLPSFVWVTPNLIHDMHDGTIADGDAFLKGLIPQIQASSWYSQGGVILVTWDEGETEEQIVLLAVSAKNAGRGAFTAQGNHYGVLRGIEEEYGLPLLGAAGDPANGDIKPLLP